MSFIVWEQLGNGKKRNIICKVLTLHLSLQNNTKSFHISYVICFPQLSFLPFLQMRKPWLGEFKEWT